MSRGDSSDELREPRVVLGDRTNRPGKKGISSDVDGLGAKLSSDNEKSIVVRDGNRQLSKHLSFGKENPQISKHVSFGKENRQLLKHVSFGKENSVVEETLPLMKEKSIHGLSSVIDDAGFITENLIRYLPELPGEKETRTHSHSDHGNVVEDSRTSSLLGRGDASMASCRSIITANRAQTDGKVVHHVRDLGMDASKVTTGSLVQETMRDGCDYLVCRIGNDDLVLGTNTPSTSSSIEGLKKSHSLGSKNFDLKGDGCVNQSPGNDLLKTCSCSFCLKASYIWSDLHYQDVSDRLAALRKSQREVSSVIQRIDSVKSSAPHGPSSLEKTSKLEAHLKNQWKSLFLHMQNALIQESSQNQVSYLELKDLREKCKMDLEAVDRTSSSERQD